MPLGTQADEVSDFLGRCSGSPAGYRSAFSDLQVAPKISSRCFVAPQLLPVNSLQLQLPIVRPKQLLCKHPSYTSALFSPQPRGCPEEGEGLVVQRDRCQL